MLIITIRTDKPEAELGLFNNHEKLDYSTWLAHRELAETLHLQIKSLLTNNEKNLAQLEGVVVYHGPGSFTGLRIGLSVANALAAGLDIPIIASGGDDWIQVGIARLAKGENRLASPEYGADPHITKPKH